MKYLSSLVLIFSSIVFMQDSALLAQGMPVVAFKNVGACFKPGYEMFAPMHGSMALSSGFIERLRFYKVTPGVGEEGKRVYIEDKALKDDPIIEIVLSFFPSPGGQLTATGEYRSYVSNRLDEADIASLFNFVHEVRDYFKVDKKLEKEPKEEIKVVVDSKKTKKKQAKKATEMSAFFEKLDLNNYLSINVDELINQLAHKSSEKKLKVNLESLLLNIVKALEQETSIDKEPSKELSKEEKKEEEERDDDGKEKVVGKALNASFYPQHMVEQIIGALFCQKFSSQESLKKMLQSLHEDIVDKSKIESIDRLLGRNDLEKATKSVQDGSASIDDIWIVLHRDSFNQVLPYRNNSTPISNGQVEMYSRNLDAEKSKGSQPGKFADCVEVTARHLMNFVFFDSKKKEFSLDKLDTFMRDKDDIYIQNLRNFYEYQSPDLADSGDTSLRSLWNKVVADLGDNIIYKKAFEAEKPNNEIKSGMLNFTRIFEDIFNLSFKNEPMLERGNEDIFKKYVEDRVSNCFIKIFEELCPGDVECDLYCSDMNIFQISQGVYDLAGNINITIEDRDSIEKLFSFTIKVSTGHIFIENLDINQLESISLKDQEVKNMTNKLNMLSKSEWSSSFFLSRDLMNSSNVISPIYKIFGYALNDADEKLKTLSRCDGLFEKVDDIHMNQIVENIMKSYLWHDDDSVLALSSGLFDDSLFKSENFKNLLKQNVLQIYLKPGFRETGQDIKEFDLSLFSQLKRLKIVGYKTFESFKGVSKSLKSLYLSKLGIEEFDLSQFSKLEELTIAYCKKIRLFHGISDSLKEIRFLNLSIKEFDLSQFSSLEKLNFKICESLQSFNGLSDSLKEIHLSEVAIEEFDLSKYSALEKLIMVNCESFESLNGFSDSLKEIYLSKAVIEEFNLSQCSALEKLSFIDCAFFESLNGSSNSLEEIYLSNLDLSSLDLSKCNALEKLKMGSVSPIRLISLPKLFPKEEYLKLQEEYPFVQVTIDKDEAVEELKEKEETSKDGFFDEN
ncbi:hypothetical protein COB28_00420 [Candidatus Dependentiae bacterium]|nr:MAG: hypothetical protein COB28_00420 [Candidatus Dependentiae bacterium]